MSNIVCNNIISSGDVTITGNFVLGTSNLNTMTVNSRSIFNGIVNCGILNINGTITQTGTNGFTSGTGKVNLQGDVEIIGNKRFTTGTGEVTINGQLYLGTDVNLTVTSETPSENTTSGAVTIIGGLGVGGNINCGENMSCIKNLSVYGDSISLKNGENYLYVNTENDISITGGRNMYVQTGGQPRLFINSTGLIGVGTLTPTEKLEIKGDVYINNPTSKLYLSNKNSYLSVDSSQMTLKTFGDISIEAGEIMGSIYMNQNVIFNKSIFLENIYGSGTTESKYYWATDGFPITSQLSNGSYLSFNNLGLEETNLTNASSALGGGGFYFHKKSPEMATSKMLMSISGDGNVGIGTSSTLYNYLTIQNTNNTLASNSPDGGGYHGLNLVSTKTGTTPYSMALGVDYTSGIGYINAGGNATTQSICLNTRGGNVGIGTSTPTAKLNVNGDTVLDGGLKINSESTPISTVFYNNGAGSGVGNQFRLVRVNGTKTTPLNVNSGDLIGIVQAQGYDTTTGNHVRSSSIAFYANQNYTSSTTNGGYLTFETTADNVGFTPTERLRVTANGDIGIGTTTPTTKLDVIGDIKASSSVISPYLFAQGKSNFLGQSLGQGSYWSWNSSNSQGETNFINVIYTGNFGGFTFSTKAPSSTSSTNLMRILGDGKVGIGTDAPTEKLDVVGTVKATDIKATNYNDTNGNKMLLQNCYWSGIINSTTNTASKSSGLTATRQGQGNFRFTFDTGRYPPNIHYHVSVALSLDGTSSLSCPLMNSVDQRTTTYFNVRLLTQAGYDTDILPNGTNGNGDGYISVMVTFIP